MRYENGTTYYTQREMDEKNAHIRALDQHLIDANAAAPADHIVIRNEFTGWCFVVVSVACNCACYEDGFPYRMHLRLIKKFTEGLPGWTPFDEELEKEQKLAERILEHRTDTRPVPRWEIGEDGVRREGPRTDTRTKEEWFDDLRALFPAQVLPTWRPEPFDKPLLAPCYVDALEQCEW